MSTLNSSLLLIIFLFPATLMTSFASTPPNEPASTTSQESTAELAKRYQQYRKEMREGPDEVRARLRDWRGPMQEVMAALGERLGSGRHASNEVIALMGPPDETLSGGSFRHGKEIPKGETHLVYWWRGGHDYLYFVVKKGIVESAQWYAALE